MAGLNNLVFLRQCVEWGRVFHKSAEWKKNDLMKREDLVLGVVDRVWEGAENFLCEQKGKEMGID